MRNLIDIMDLSTEEIEELIALADYVTRFQKEKHPYDLGIPARTGVEF